MFNWRHGNHGWTQARLPSPGTGNYAYQRHFTDPVVTVEGHGIDTGTWRLFGSPPMIANGAVTLAGIGGVIAGQYVLAPLIVPPGETGSI